MDSALPDAYHTCLQRDLAHERLLALVKQCRAAGRERLPPLRACAAQLRCSYTTLVRATSRLAQSGEVDVRHGSGVWLHAPESYTAVPPPDPAARLPRAVVAARQVRGEILLGKYTPGEPMPPAKEMAARHGVSARTMARALAALAGERLVSRYKRTYAVLPPVLPRAGGTIVVVARGFRRGLPAVFSQRYQGVVGLMEEQCLPRRVRLEVSTYSFTGTGLRAQDDWIESPARWRSRRAAPPLGFVVFANTLEPHLGPVVNTLSSHRVPVAIIREDGSGAHPLPSEGTGAPVPITMVNAVCDEAAGKTVAQYLLSIGHRRVAFLGGPESYSWSTRRYRGAAEVFAAFPGETALVPLHLPVPPPGHNVRARWTRLVNGGYAESLLSCAIGASEPVSARMRRLLIDNYLFDESLLLLMPLNSLFGFERVAADAVQRRECTAWICANESIAMLAYDYLQSRRIAVPQRLSLVGIDDVSHTLGRRITMYRFNVQGAISAALNALFYPSPTRVQHAAVPEMLIEGTLIERSSSAPLQ